MALPISGRILTVRPGGMEREGLNEEIANDQKFAAIKVVKL
jgi:hypothetical protein